MKKILALLLCFPLSACTEAKAGTFTVSVGVEAVDLLPFGSNDVASYRVRSQIYERLIYIDQEGRLIPGLAQSWKQASPDKIELTLRPGVRFQNGDLLSVEDVVYSLESAAKAPTLRAILGIIKGAEALGEDKVLVTFKQAAYLSLYSLASSGMLIGSKKVLQANAEGGELAYVGTGPYKFSEWKRGQKIVLEAFDGYWGEKPEIKNIEVLSVPEESIRALALEGGTVQLAYDIGPGDRERISQDPKINFLEIPLVRTEYLGMNTKKGALQDKRVRQAIAYAVNTPGMIQAVLMGAAEEAQSMVSPACEGFYAVEPKRTRDLEKARALLRSAGLPPEIKLTLMAPPDIRSKTAETIQASLKEIGINVDIQILEFGTFLETLGRGDSMLFLSGWTPSTPNADMALYSLLYSESTGSTTGNFSFFNNKIFDGLLNAARGEFNKAKRDDLYRQAQEILYTELPLIPLYNPKANIGLAKKYTIDFYSMELNLWKTIKVKS